jgi:DNA-binding NtrC family response regulator
VIERAVALERTPVIQLDSLPADVRAPEADVIASDNGGRAIQLPAQGLDLPRHLENREREFVQQALKQTDGRHDRAAKLLGITARQLRHLLDKYDLRRHRPESGEVDVDGTD